jgi:hypothetical protein
LESVWIDLGTLLPCDAATFRSDRKLRVFAGPDVGRWKQPMSRLNRRTGSVDPATVNHIFAAIATSTSPLPAGGKAVHGMVWDRYRLPDGGAVGAAAGVQPCQPFESKAYDE